MRCVMGSKQLNGNDGHCLAPLPLTAIGRSGRSKGSPAKQGRLQRPYRLWAIFAKRYDCNGQTRDTAQLAVISVQPDIPDVTGASKMNRTADCSDTAAAHRADMVGVHFQADTIESVGVDALIASH